MSKSDFGSDDFQAWMKVACAHPLLTRAQEVELAKRIERGDLAAKDRLVRCNIKLVAHNAKSFRGQGLAYEDLVQEGMFGLLRAAEKYDWQRGFRFSSYATHWIRQTLMRGIGDRGRSVRLPINVHEKLRKLCKAERALVRTTGREPSTAELAATLEWPESRVAALLDVRQPAKSLNAPVSEAEGTAEVGDLLPDTSGCVPHPEVAAAEAGRAASVKAALADLPYRERQVLRMRYGLDGDVEHTLDQVAVRFGGLQRERVRQVELRAFDAIRAGEHAEALFAELG